jgi:hypothetical protein
MKKFCFSLKRITLARLYGARVVHNPPAVEPMEECFISLLEGGATQAMQQVLVTTVTRGLARAAPHGNNAWDHI